jgi:hypothetical protein
VKVWKAAAILPAATGGTRRSCHHMERVRTASCCRTHDRPRQLAHGFASLLGSHLFQPQLSSRVLVHALSCSTASRCIGAASESGGTHRNTEKVSSHTLSCFGPSRLCSASAAVGTSPSDLDLEGVCNVLCCRPGNGVRTFVFSIGRPP